MVKQLEDDLAIWLTETGHVNIAAGKVQRRFAVHPFIDEEAEYVPYPDLLLLYTVTLTNMKECDRAHVALSKDGALRNLFHSCRVSSDEDYSTDDSESESGEEETQDGFIDPSISQHLHSNSLDMMAIYRYGASMVFFHSSFQFSFPAYFCDYTNIKDEMLT